VVREASTNDAVAAPAQVNLLHPLARKELPLENLGLPCIEIHHIWAQFYKEVAYFCCPSPVMFSKGIYDE
jgi:hypothetical protein